MSEQLDYLKHCASELEGDCRDLEKAAATMEELLDQHIAESPVEQASYQLLEEAIDAQCAMARCVIALAHAVHQHVTDMGIHKTP